MTETRQFPEFISFGEALTDLIRTGPNQWQSVPGGAPWNVAMVMAHFGVASAFGGAISTDCFGDAQWQASQRAGLDLRFTQRLAKSPLLAVVHETHPPQYYFIGDESADLHFSVEDLPTGWVQAVRWAHFGCISLVRQPLGNRLVALAERLRQQGVKISYDPNFRNLMDERYDPILARMAALADLIKVSEEDLRGLFRTTDETAALARLRALNPAAACFFTQGAQSAAIYADGQCWQAMPPKIEVVDTVGAGDTSLAGLLSSLMRQPQAGWGEHLRVALAAGAGACLAAGASPPSASVLQRLCGEVRFLGA